MLELFPAEKNPHSNEELVNNKLLMSSEYPLIEAIKRHATHNYMFFDKECDALSDHGYARRRRVHLQRGRKIGCKATAVVKELLRYKDTLYTHSYIVNPLLDIHHILLLSKLNGLRRNNY